MSAVAEIAVPVVATPARGAKLRAALGRWGPGAGLLVFFAYLLVPIVVMLVMSFNAPAGRFSFSFDRFSAAAWQDPLGPPGLSNALQNTLKLALIATTGSVVLGTLMALGLARYRFRGRTFGNLFVLMPMTTPEVVFGSGLLIFFVSTTTDPILRSLLPGKPFFPPSMVTLVVSHITFTMAFVVITVRSRVAALDPNLEAAARDLGASEWVTFTRVTLPLLAPGILAGALLAFSLSIDDFIVSQFTAGSTSVLPLWILGSLRNRFPSEIWVLGSIIFLVTAGVGLIGAVRSLRAASISTSRCAWSRRSSARA